MVLPDNASAPAAAVLGSRLAYQLQGLAMQALQRVLERAEVESALQRLVQGVAEACQAQVLVCRRNSAGETVLLAASPGTVLPRPETGEALLLGQALEGRSALGYGGWLAMPVQHHGRRLAALAVVTPGDRDLGRLAPALDPVVITLATLLARPRGGATLAPPSADAARVGGPVAPAGEEAAGPIAPHAATAPGATPAAALPTLAPQPPGAAGPAHVPAPMPASLTATEPGAVRPRGRPAPVLQVPAEVLRAAMRESGTYVWEWDLRSDTLADIDEGALMLGYAKGELGHTQRDWNRIIHADDLAPLEQAYEAHRRGERGLFEHVYRARARDGSWRWVQERGRIVEWNSDGSPRRMVGIQCDVSGRIGPLLAERAQAEEFRRLMHHLPGVLLVYRAVAGRRGRFEFVSPRSREVLGVEPEPLMNDALLVLGRIDQEDLARLQARAARCSVLGQPVHMRLHLAGRDPCWVEVHASGQPQGGDVVWYTHVRRVGEAGAAGGAEADEPVRTGA